MSTAACVDGRVAAAFRAASLSSTSCAFACSDNNRARFSIAVTSATTLVECCCKSLFRASASPSSAPACVTAGGGKTIVPAGSPEYPTVPIDGGAPASAAAPPVPTVPTPANAAAVAVAAAAAAVAVARCSSKLLTSPRSKDSSSKTAFC